MYHETVVKAAAGLRFGPKSLDEFIERMKAIFTSRKSDIEIDVRFGTARGTFASVADLMAEDLPDTLIYDVKIHWSSAGESVSLSRFAEVQFGLHGSTMLWVVQASKLIPELLAPYEYREPLIEFPQAPFSVVFYPKGLPGRPEAARVTKPATLISTAELESKPQIVAWEQPVSPQLYQYDVAISYARANRAHVEPLARYLKALGIRVFYDYFEKVTMLGTNLIPLLADVYLKHSRFAVAFISQEYAERDYTRHEFAAISNRVLRTKESDIYLLPIRIDDTEIAGLYPSIAYLDARLHTSVEICHIVSERFAFPNDHKHDQLAPPFSLETSGVIQFDYSSHNGHYEIGDGGYRFETMWSSASENSIHGYNDPESIRGIALAPRGARLQELSDASQLDFTSRSQTAEVGDVVVLRNKSDFYAALQVLGVNCRGRNADRNELTLAYTILSGGGSDFSSVAS